MLSYHLQARLHRMDSREIDIAGIGSGTVLRRKEDGKFIVDTDDVAVEEPLEIRVNDRAIAVTMRTPGNDTELAAGFLLSEKIIDEPADIEHVEERANTIRVKLGKDFEAESVSQRFGTISASCGLCGKTSIESIRQNFPPIAPSDVKIGIEQLLQLPDKLRKAQGNFARTGGIHAAGIFDLAGELLVAREDVGRHNAVDKAIGRALLNGKLPLSGHVLMVSGRSSLEIVQKGLAAGIAIVASVSAPSSLAANFAREMNQTLIGFLRPPTFNVYAHVERLNAG